MLNAQTARELGNQLKVLIAGGQDCQALDLLAPILSQRIPFRLLDLTGQELGKGNPQEIDQFLDRVAEGKTMGGWVIIASALSRRMQTDLPGVFSLCRKYILIADVWYGTDILGERIPGPALEACFEPALSLLAGWREDSSRWVRRTVGVAIHVWAKRARGDPRLISKAGSLLDFIDPMFSESEIDVVKGVGWGLKTLGRYYPDLVANWLANQAARRRPQRALILRKALTYLSDDQRARALGGLP